MFGFGKHDKFIRDFKRLKTKTEQQAAIHAYYEQQKNMEMVDIIKLIYTYQIREDATNDNSTSPEHLDDLLKTRSTYIQSLIQDGDPRWQEIFPFHWPQKTCILYERMKGFIALSKNGGTIICAQDSAARKLLPKQIIGCEIIDNFTTITNTSKDGSISRAILGGALLGGVGALAGAASASSTSYSTEHKDFQLAIMLDSLETPHVLIDFGSLYEKQCREWYSRINLIIRTQPTDDFNQPRKPRKRAPKNLNGSK